MGVTVGDGVTVGAGVTVGVGDGSDVAAAHATVEDRSVTIKNVAPITTDRK